MRLMTLVAIAAFSLHPLCGETIRSTDARNITGGQPVTVCDDPAVVVVVGVVEPVRACTGSLINASWVLSAAHCVDGLPLESLVVGHGYPQYHETRLAAEAVMHPEYDPLAQPGGWAHDLALIRMEAEFLSRTAAAATMADALDSLFLLPGAAVTVVGWGGIESTTMTAAEKTLTVCPEIPDWAVCTESLANPTLQEGDSGGPLLLEIDGEKVLAAVNSWKAPSPSPSAPARSRYVRVAEHREWIDSVVEGTADRPDPCAVDPVAPIVQTPAPPPSPEPFQPQLVEVALGESGTTVTLMTAEGGGYTLNREAFAGGEVEAENGDTYELKLEDGRWTATLKP